jgi:hypothetical protein
MDANDALGSRRSLKTHGMNKRQSALNGRIPQAQWQSIPPAGIIRSAPVHKWRRVVRSVYLVALAQKLSPEKVGD